MADAYADWIVEVSNTTGTSDYELGDPPAGTSYFPFRHRYADGTDTVCYWVRNNDRTKWEKHQLETLTYGSPGSDTLSRAGLVESTNSDGPVSWVPGDLPLTIYVAPDSDIAEGASRGWLAATRDAMRRYGWWFKQDAPSAGLQQVTVYDGSTDIRLGYVNPTRHTVRWDYLPPGAVIAYAGSSIQTGFLACDGASLLRADYPDLFDAIGTTYGAADGTHFNVPDILGRVIAGKEASATRLTSGVSGVNGASLGATGGSQSMQAHAHTANGGNPYLTANSGDNVYAQIVDGGGTVIYYRSTSATVGAGGSQNVQPTIVLNYMIKT